MHSSPFLQALVEAGVVADREAERLFAEHRGRELDVARHLFAQAESAARRTRIGRLYGDFVGTAYIELDRTLFQPEALRLIDAETAAEHRCMPIYALNGTLTVAVSDPDDRRTLKAVEAAAGIPISPVFAFPSEIVDAIEVQYGTSAALEALGAAIRAEMDGSDEEIDAERLRELGSSAGVVELVRGMLLYSVKYDASDIHIQPTASSILVRYRVDGVLRTMLELPKANARAIASRLKIMADLDIAERRLPQDGRVQLELKGRSQGFRFSSIPTVHGEKLVLRAVGQGENSTITPIGELGLSKRNRELIERLMGSPNGVLFVTGPTGSGKTTTLYSVLAELNQPHVNIVTVEDPVEYRMDGISQVQTHEQIGLTFASALRSILRQDPEVILIGEIRDLETAKIAAEAALTGHLVMATVHTNSAPQAVTRLVEIGVEPFLLAPSLIGVVGQRLVRRICEGCKEPYTPEPEVVEANFYNVPDRELTFYRGRGCELCDHTGYLRRIAIHEVLLLSDGTREQIANKGSVLQVREGALDEGFRPMRYDGLLKVLQGITTLEEVNRVTGEAPL